MIRIHRAKPIVYVGDQAVRLSRMEHRLLVTLGMMDNRLTPHAFLLEVLFDGRNQLPGDLRLLWIRMYQLRRKIGAEHLESNRFHGYILKGDVEFIGSSMERQ